MMAAAGQVSAPNPNGRIHCHTTLENDKPMYQSGNGCIRNRVFVVKISAFESSGVATDDSPAQRREKTPCKYQEEAVMTAAMLMRTWRRQRRRYVRLTCSVNGGLTRILVHFLLGVLAVQSHYAARLGAFVIHSGGSSSKTCFHSYGLGQQNAS